MFKKLSLALLVSGCILNTAQANISCSGKVEGIQVHSTYALVNLGNKGWYRISKHLNSINFNARMALVLSAQETGHRLTLQFPNNYNCSSGDTKIAPSYIHVHSS